MKALLVASLVGLGAVVGPAVEVGTVNGKPPTKDELKVPKSDDGVPKVGLHADIKGVAKAGETRTVYVLVSPISSPELAGKWWVQAEVEKTADKFTAEAQFGEEGAGAGEYFAVVGVATDKTWAAGDQVTELPAAAAYSKVKVVKRTPSAGRPPAGR